MSATQVLLVDDCFEIQDVVKLILDSEGFKTTTVSDGAEAMNLLRAGARYSLILLDLNLRGGAKAHTLLYRMKQEGLAKDVPIFFFTAAFDASEIDLPEGVFGMIQKPFRIAEFLETVRNVTRKKLNPIQKKTSGLGQKSTNPDLKASI